MSRFASERRTFFVEEPVAYDDPSRAPHMDVRAISENLFLVVPRLPAGLSHDETTAALRQLLDEELETRAVRDYVLWYYTPMALDFTRHLRPVVSVYDCMDELSAFRGAPRELGAREQELFARVDVAFTGGRSLFEAKREQHANVHAMPSSVDAAHFAIARADAESRAEEPADQAALPGPRLGFFGVVDERMDLELLATIADARPEWQIVMIGPVVKIDPQWLPRRANIHYLGPKTYQELPHYLAGWDVALMPFAVNESTRFISPTKTLEYLAAGVPVVSSAIRDVVQPYGELGLVRVADCSSFVREIEETLAEDPAPRRAAADAFLAHTSWDRTWARMSRLMNEVVAERLAPAAAAEE